MNANKTRDILVKGLYDYLNNEIPVYRSGQVNSEEDLPYIIYSVVSVKKRGNTQGHYGVRKTDGGAEEIRSEQVSGTLSFTVCSQDRDGENGEYIQGEDESQEIAEKAQGWFLHAGYEYFSSKDIVISEVTEIQGRNTLLIGEEVNRKGFDVIFNYIAEDKRNIAVVNKVRIKRNGR